jgi:peptidoglycan/LPS O-acetylase OafA/YrhL
MDHTHSPAADSPERGRPGSEGSHIPGLDGVRALACLAVFGVHWQQFTGFTASAGPFDAKRLLENGNTGVAVLFMLSAFLLSRPFWSGRHERAGVSWGRYALSRALRIMPAYYACLLALAVLKSDWSSESDLNSLLLHLTFLHTWTERTFYDISPPFWTIAIQAHSYVVMPIVALVIVRLSASWQLRASILAGLAVVAYVAHWTLLSWLVPAWAANQPTVATHTVLAHMPHFVLGMLAGLIHERTSLAGSRADAPGWRWDASVLLAAAGILVVLSTPVDGQLAVPFGRYNLPLVPLAIGWLIVAIPRAPVTRVILDWAPIRLFGVVSYGVYVYHYACMEAVSRLMSRFGLVTRSHEWLFGAASLLGTIVIASVSYRYFEEPLQRWFRGGRRPLPASAAG